MTRVFLDENVDPRLASLLQDYHVKSSADLGLNGLSNGALLREIEDDFDVILTHDRNMEYQHNWKLKELGLIVLRTEGNTVRAYEPFLSDIRKAIDNCLPSVIVSVG